MTSEAPQMLSIEERLKQLRAGVDAVYPIRMRQLEVPVRVLSIDEIMACRAQAKKSRMQAGQDDIFEDVELEIATLSLAAQIPAGSPTGSMLPEKMLRALSADELNFLYKEFCVVMNRVNPSAANMDPKDFRQLVEALKKNLVTSKDLSLMQLKAICSAFQDMIQRQEDPSSPTDK